MNSYTSKGRKEDVSKLKGNEYLVKTVIGRHKKYSDFLRTVTVVLDSTGHTLQMGLVLYSFVGKEHKVSPHKHPVSQKPSKVPSAKSRAASGCKKSASCASGERQEDIIGFFKDSGLPEFLRGSWQNANKIVNVGGVGPHPTDSTKRCVLSLSQSITHTVVASRGFFKCDDSCPRFKECGICAHNIAVAHSSGRLREFVQGYKAPLSTPAGSGKEGNEETMKRKRKSHPEHDVSSCGDRNKAAARLPKSTDLGNTPYEVVFVKETSATTCYGCKGKVREKSSDVPPPPPYDVFIRHLERRVYRRRGETKLNIFKHPEMVYYHPTKGCCSTLQDGKKRNSLTEAHRQLLCREFGFKC